jgi:ribulose-phosphate 3-epimerase
VQFEEPLPEPLADGRFSNVTRAPRVYSNFVCERRRAALATVIDLAPSILSANFAQLGADAKAALEGGGTVLHLDVMDGHFVPNLTIGPPVVASLRKTVPDVTFDCHLMIENADEFIPAFAEAGANWISVHQEACVHLDRTLHLIESHGCKPGVVINPATPVHTLDDVLEIVHHVLVMSVNPGFGAQHFIPYSLRKVEALAGIRESRGLGFRIEIDGGVALDTVGDIVRAGAEILVAGNAVFSHGDIRENASKLLQAARSAAGVKASPRLRRTATAPRSTKSDRHRRQT